MNVVVINQPVLAYRKPVLAYRKPNIFFIPNVSTLW